MKISILMLLFLSQLITLTGSYTASAECSYSDVSHILSIGGKVVLGNGWTKSGALHLVNQLNHNIQSVSIVTSEIEPDLTYGESMELLKIGVKLIIDNRYSTGEIINLSQIRSNGIMVRASNFSFAQLIDFASRGVGIMESANKPLSESELYSISKNGGEIAIFSKFHNSAEITSLINSSNKKVHINCSDCGGSEIVTYLNIGANVWIRMREDIAPQKNSIDSKIHNSSPNETKEPSIMEEYEAKRKELFGPYENKPTIWEEYEAEKNKLFNPVEDKSTIDDNTETLENNLQSALFNYASMGATIICD